MVRSMIRPATTTPAATSRGNPSRRPLVKPRPKRRNRHFPVIRFQTAIISERTARSKGNDTPLAAIRTCVAAPSASAIEARLRVGEIECIRHTAAIPPTQPFHFTSPAFIQLRNLLVSHVDVFQQLLITWWSTAILRWTCHRSIHKSSSERIVGLHDIYQPDEMLPAVSEVVQVETTVSFSREK